MFGHQTNHDDANADQNAATLQDAGSAHVPTTIAPTPAASAPTVGDDPVSDASDYVMTDLPHTAAPAAGSTGAALPVTPVSAPEPSTSPTTTTAAVHDQDLLELKQSALHELSPLVGHLEQTPEEKFRTTMMMIQASDDQSLLKEALAAAKQISDEKARAQALLDVVNEINYFTQQHADASTS